ncbi:MAG: sugar phosphate isomerase/epimerase [Eubacteriales bacterium]|jgi:sugar phosphate isomerase/epimerase|nr:sugar phosphate isomerase/epimerase [Eubacteriales bacterium]
MQNNLPVALQLYSVRDFAEKDLRKTLQKVKEIGYDFVETAGLYGFNPEHFYKELSDSDLKAISAHVPIDELIADTEGTIERYITIGCKYIAIPYLSEGMRPGDKSFNDVLDKIDAIGRICNSKNVVLLYHNHDFEFIKMTDGSYGFDYIYSYIDSKNLKTEIDTCWIKVAGHDPAAYIRKYTGRAPVVHLKDYVGTQTENMYELISSDADEADEMDGMDERKVKADGKFAFRPVGYGLQDFPSILEASLDAGAEYVVVEQDSSEDCTSLEAAAKSRDYLKSLGW